MHKAAQLLRENGQTVKAIAAQVGYDSLAAFTNAFRAFHGMTPSHYRGKAPLPAGAGDNHAEDRH